MYNISVKLKFAARVILVAIVFIGAASYVVDFLNPLTPDPPVILKSLQWRVLVIFVASIVVLKLQGEIRARMHAAAVEMQSNDAKGKPVPANKFVLDLTCARLI